MKRQENVVLCTINRSPSPSHLLFFHRFFLSPQFCPHRSHDLISKISDRLTRPRVLWRWQCNARGPLRTFDWWFPSCKSQSRPLERVEVEKDKFKEHLRKKRKGM